MGRPKQLLDLAGKPVLRRVVESVLAAPVHEVVVVLGHRADDVAHVVPVAPRIRHVLNDRYAEGQATSLAAGLRALGGDCEAAVVTLGDQPGIRPDAVEAVVRAFWDGQGPVVQASYGGRLGHPTLIGRDVWAEVLAEMAGDEGARPVLARHPDWRVTVEVGGRLPDDIDTEDDYLRVRAQFEADNR